MFLKLYGACKICNAYGPQLETVKIIDVIT